MTDVPMWRGFAFMDGDPDGVHDELRALADWQVGDFIRWCQVRGYDHVYLCRSSETTRFEKAEPPEGIRHEFGSVVPLREGGGRVAARSDNPLDVA